MLLLEDQTQPIKIEASKSFEGRHCQTQEWNCLSVEYRSPLAVLGKRIARDSLRSRYMVGTEVAGKRLSTVHQSYEKETDPAPATGSETRH